MALEDFTKNFKGFSKNISKQAKGLYGQAKIGTKNSLAAVRFGRPIFKEDPKTGKINVFRLNFKNFITKDNLKEAISLQKENELMAKFSRKQLLVNEFNEQVFKGLANQKTKKISFLKKENFVYQYQIKTLGGYQTVKGNTTSDEILSESPEIIDEYEQQTGFKVNFGKNIDEKDLINIIIR